jgi:hypothetical protein
MNFYDLHKHHANEREENARRQRMAEEARRDRRQHNPKRKTR